MDIRQGQPAFNPHAPWCCRREHETLGLDEFCWTTFPVGGLELRVSRLTDDVGACDAEALLYWPGSDDPVVDLTPGQARDLAAAVLRGG